MKHRFRFSRSMGSGCDSDHHTHLEHRLVIAVAGGTDEEFREYVVARGPALLRAAYQLTGNPNDAEDLLQVALVKTYLAWDRIQDHTALDRYVRRAMVNINISWWRRRKLEEYPSEELPEPVLAGGPHLPERVEQALDRLPTRMRTAVVLRYYEDMTESEIAKTLGISVGTVKSTVSRGMAKLRGDLTLSEPRELEHRA
ncbi:SigE family RNA polymerase sigma factor [Streptosporangium sp. NBC_01755]|uniref:SigE family RNA polymerase sigma factor n=1 Tax=unclassified Streptosporangium TaxID=2632669 RepID=UPI002DD96E60|nr:MULTISPECIES: SigE family RNA polymerase sigma factor [unclassified Streptosporangium]WSA25105.1 SigE family RNA polymerase sigma factor [Streptosporangium sp. NBC_01810]WSD03554.1 SigE family RNA polymerase sigma factor [Streptosporangium sp. NBC_01755]